MTFDLHLAEYWNQREIATARREWCFELHNSDELCKCEEEAREAEELAELAKRAFNATRGIYAE